MPTTLAFGPFRLDTGADVLYRGTEPVAVSQRAVALLRVLIKRAGSPVAKDSLIEGAWPGLAVEDSNLTVQIAALRRVFASEPGGERWIETLPRRGYRFVGPVEATAAKGDLAPQEPAEAAAALPLPDKPSIAVLPFENLSGDPEQEYFVEGLAGDVITALSRFHWFFVIARNSSFAYKGRAIDVKKIAGELGVQYVLEGSVRKAANRVRIAVQLIDALTGRHVWAERYDRDLEDIFALQDEVTEAIVGAVAPSFISAEARRVQRKPPERFDAWDYVMRGNWHLSRRRQQDFAEAGRLFDKALEIDPNSTTALSGLALTLCWMIPFGWAGDPEDTLAKAYSAARQAVEIEENNADAYVSLAMANFFMHDLDAAVEACRRALELNPNLAAAEGWLGNVLSWRGDYDEAVSHAEKAARLSPRDPTYSWWSLARTSAAFGAASYGEAAQWARKMIEIAPEFPVGWRYLASSLAHLGRLDDARAAKDRLLGIVPHENLRQIRELLPSVNVDRIERFVGGLRKAGVPE